jgi:tetratricopeptide (TPR) repeat protein
MRWPIRILLLLSWLVALPVQAMPPICPKFTFPELPPEPKNSLGVPGPAPTHSTIDLFQPVEEAYQKQQFVGAERQLRTILQQLPDYDRAWQRLGDALRRQGKFAEAKAAYDRAIQLNKRNIQAYEGLAVLDLPKANEVDLPALGVLRWFDEDLAIKTHRAFLQANPDYDKAYKVLEQTLMLRAGRETKGDIFTASLVENGTDLDEVIGISKTIAPDQIGEFVEFYEQAHARFPQQQDFFRNLTRFLQAQENYEQAIRVIKQQIQRQPQSSDLRLELGSALLRAKQLDPAQTAFCQARQLLQNPIQVDPWPTTQSDLSIALKGLARVLRAKHQIQQAIELYEAEIKAAPTPQIADSLRYGLSQFLKASEQK